MIQSPLIIKSEINIQHTYIPGGRISIYEVLRNLVIKTAHIFPYEI